MALSPRRLELTFVVCLMALSATWLPGIRSWAQDAAEAPAETPAETPAGDAQATQAAAEEPKLEPVKVVFGTIDGDISLEESAYVIRLLDEARVAKADVVMIELNTFGGRVDAAVAIRDALIDAPQKTVVFINKRAISAGALISLACDKIAISAGGTIGAATPIVQVPGEELPKPVEEKYLSYFRQEMRSTAETKGRNGDLAEAMVDAELEVEGVVEKGKLLTLTTTTALEHGFADVQATSASDALRQLGYDATIDEIEHTWSEKLVAFLTSAPIAGLLGLAMVVFGYLEYQTPGFGIFGITAIVCFLLLYFGHYMVNLAGYEELIFFFVGLVLLFIELFVLPGFGITGMLGLTSIVVAMVLMLSAGDWSDIHFDNPFTQDAVIKVAWVMVAGVAAILVMLRYLPHTRVAGGIVLSNELEAAAGFSSHQATADDMAGKTGVTLSPLRPSGMARIDDKRVGVETEGDWIESGKTVRVVRQVEGRCVVREVATPATGAAGPEEVA